MKKYKVIHQREGCIGCNSCVFHAPQSWTMDPFDGKSTLIGSKQKGDVYVGEIFECDLEDNLNAEKGCPMQIITIEHPHRS
jgi:ferredoxin